MGVAAIGLVFASLIALPFLSQVNVGSPRFRVLTERLYWVLVADVFLLTWVGAQEIMPATVLLGQICSFILFAYLLLVLPFLGWLEGVFFLHASSLASKATDANRAYSFSTLTRALSYAKRP